MSPQTDYTRAENTLLALCLALVGMAAFTPIFAAGKIADGMLPVAVLVWMRFLGGAVTVETVFSWPGLGYLTFQALSAPDFPLLQGTFVVFSSIVIIMNFFADIVYRLLDPRLRAA